MDQQELEQRFEQALRKEGLLKTADTDVELPVRSTTVVETREAKDPAPEADKKPVPPPTFINLFQHPLAHPYVLDVALLQKYGPEWMEWERETLEHRIPQDFRTTSISDLNFEKLQAMKTLHYVDGFWGEWEIFLACVMPLNGLFADFRMMQVPTVPQCAVAVDIANRVRDDVGWSDEVKTYLSVVHRHDGILVAIEPLDFVPVDPMGHGTEAEEVKRRWPDVRRTNTAPKEETLIAEQLRRLLLIQDALEGHRELLQAQLPLLLHA